PTLVTLSYTLRISLWISSFLFYCDPAPRDLHSFPTRRSSDLASSCCPVTLGFLSSLCSFPLSFDFFKDADSNVAPPPYLGTAVRSEEHTSELQSRFDLVCRLLLEKKNSKDYREPSFATFPYCF